MPQHLKRGMFNLILPPQLINLSDLNHKYSFFHIKVDNFKLNIKHAINIQSKTGFKGSSGIKKSKIKDQICLLARPGRSKGP